MKKDNVRVEQDELTGITVIIHQHTNTYDVELFIPRGTFYESNKITVSNKQFTLSAMIPEENISQQISYYTCFSKGYEKVKNGLIKNTRVTIKFQINDCSGSITLNPKFYILSTRRATPKNLKKAKQLEESTITIAHEKPSASKYAPYKYTNITRPYSGGRASSK